MDKNNENQSDPQNAEESHGYQNILKMILFIAVLIGAWFLLDWLINGK